jgi:predicted kinase
MMELVILIGLQAAGKPTYTGIFDHDETANASRHHRREA